MSKFLTGSELNSEIEKIFEKAEEHLILISPFIKLHKRYASTLKTKISKPKIKITVVFGKNEDDMSKSMKKEDFDFFKEFPNIEIRYEKRLHAKYFANEAAAIMTSMNLYDYSQNNNIEAGVLSNPTLFGSMAKDLLTNVTGEEGYDKKAADYFDRVIEQSDLLFKREPVFESKMLGLKKDYVISEITTDSLSDFFKNTILNSKTAFRKTKSATAPSSYDSSVSKGYCIRTGKEIPFNPDKPLSNEAFKSWNKFGDANYPEKFCHFSGVASEGNTSVTKPILKKNWKKAKDKYNL